MYIKQISVFLENTVGRLAEFTELLHDNGIDLKALSIAETSEFGILRCIVENPEEAVDVIQTGGFKVNLTKVIAAEAMDIPGGLHRVLQILYGKGISVEYVYSIIRSRENHAVIIIKASDVELAGRVLQESNVKMYCQEEL